MRFRPAIICLLFLYPLSLQAQKHHYHIQHYTTDNGLPQNSITGIAFDKTGYCWLGTEMGLVRFDGKDFTIFNSANLPGLYSPRIQFCSTDNDNDVYMKGEGGGLIRIKTDGRLSAPYPQTVKESDKWFWNSYSHVPRFVAAKGRKQLPEMDLPSGYTYLLPSGDIYCVDKNRLYYLQDDRAMLADTTLAGLKDIYIGTGDYFVAIQKGQPVKWWKKGIRQRDLTSMPGDLQENTDFKNGKFQCFYKNGQAFIYTGGDLYGVYETTEGFSTRLLLEELDIPVISAVFYNKEQNKYYIGSLVSGLFIVTPSRFSFLGNKPEIFSKSVFSQAIRNNGEIICQRFLYEPSGRVRELPLNPAVGATLWLDQDRYLYYGDEPALFRYDFETNTSKQVAQLDSRPSSIFRDRFDTGSIIVGTSFGVGKFYGESIQETKRLPGNSEIISILQTGRDSFIAATKSGVKWYDFAKDRIYRKLLDSVYVRNVYEDSDHRVWIASYERGFYLFQNGELFAFPAKAGLRSVHSFVEDGLGNFWLPTNNGLFVVKKQLLLDYAKGKTKNLYFYVYSTLDNLPTNEFNGGCTPAYIWTKEGEVSIPSIAGLVKFDPLRMDPLLPDKGIYAEEYRLNDSVIQPGNNSLSLDPDYDKLTISISSPYFGNPENLQMVYMIKGLDNNWQPVPANNEIVLNHIRPGDYKLMVHKTNDADNASFTIDFSIKPWFYNTWWFYSLLLAAACLGVFVYVRIRTGMLKERNVALKAIISIQTADLNKTVAQLQASEKELKESNIMKDWVTTMVLHDLRSPIRFLYTISSQLRRKHQDLTKEEMQKNLDMLQSSTHSLNDFTEQFFTWAASQHRDFKIKEETFSLQTLFNELEELYRDIVNANNNILLIKPADLTVHTDRNILSTIIRNLLDNAGKNTVNGEIELSANQLDDDGLMISVSDTGPGISKEAVAEFYAGYSHAGSTGNGSAIIINLLEKIGGKLWITSEAGRGTVFSVQLDRHRSGQPVLQAD